MFTKSISLIILLFLFVCIANYTLDPYIAFTILGRHAHFYAKHAVPDILLWWVLFSSLCAWGGYFLLQKTSRFRALMFAYGTLVPISFLFKILFKFIFARSNPRACLMHHAKYGFHWFSWSNVNNSFPSGHMLVFTVGTLLIISFLPKLRILGYLFLMLLGIALVVTEYHFVSDVVAGFILGYSMVWGYQTVMHGMPKRSLAVG